MKRNVADQGAHPNGHAPTGESGYWSDPFREIEPAQEAALELTIVLVGRLPGA